VFGESSRVHRLIFPLLVIVPGTQAERTEMEEYTATMTFERPPSSLKMEQIIPILGLTMVPAVVITRESTLLCVKRWTPTLILVPSQKDAFSI